MAHDPLIVAAQAEPAVEAPRVTVGEPRLAPSPEQQRVADELFSREQSQAVAALLGLHTGLAIVQHLVAETFPPQPPPDEPRRGPEAADPA